jgi:hypothetical protein
MTFDGKRVRLYVGGHLVASHARHRRLPGGHATLTIGAAGGRHFKGRLDDVRVYSRALGGRAIRRDMRRAV